MALCLLPTACDFGGVPASGGGGYGAPADSEEPSGGTVVVPVGNQQPGGGQGGRGNGYGGGQQGGGNQGGGNQGGGGNNQPPAAEDPAAEDPAAEDPAAEDPAAEDPAAEDPAAEDPAAEDPAAEDPAEDPAAEDPAEDPAEEEPPPPANNGLDVLGTSCADSDLPLHTGFQSNDAQCVQSSHGEVAPGNQLPSLLITSAPEQVAVGETFELQVSTRNLVRDRFLGAAAGGYYLESSFLNDAGLQRGHFHTACRLLPNTDEAPNSAALTQDAANFFFIATQDNGGGSAPDTVTIPVEAFATAGTAQCTSWAGDGSHRTPMMSFANQTPSIDSVRIEIVVGGGGGDDAAADDAAAEEDAAADDAAADDAAADDAAADDAAADDAAADDAAADEADNGGNDNGGNDNG